MICPFHRFVGRINNSKGDSLSPKYYILQFTKVFISSLFSIITTRLGEIGAQGLILQIKETEAQKDKGHMETVEQS